MHATSLVCTINETQKRDHCFLAGLWRNWRGRGKEGGESRHTPQTCTLCLPHKRPSIQLPGTTNPTVLGNASSDYQRGTIKYLDENTKPNRRRGKALSLHLSSPNEMEKIKFHCVPLLGRGKLVRLFQSWFDCFQSLCLVHSGHGEVSLGCGVGGGESSHWYHFHIWKQHVKYSRAVFQNGTVTGIALFPSNSGLTGCYGARMSVWCEKYAKSHANETIYELP